MGVSLNVAALCTSFLAVVISSVLTTQTIRLLRSANHLPVIVNVLDKQRSADFTFLEQRLWRELGTYDPTLGFSRLPEEMERLAVEVALFYQGVSHIVLDGLVEWQPIVLQVQNRTVRTWVVIEPFVRGERSIRGGEFTFLNSYESFVLKIKNLDMQALSERRRRGTLKRARL